MCVVVGVQTLAPPMQSILSRLHNYDHVKIEVFSDDTILNAPVSQWPLCDCLVAFFSKGFPLQKATEYVKLRNPFLFNDLSLQYALQDRYMYIYMCRYMYIYNVYTCIYMYTVHVRMNNVQMYIYIVQCSCMCLLCWTLHCMHVRMCMCILCFIAGQECMIF